MSFCERGAKDNPWMESFWGRFKVENGSLFGDAATLGELEWTIGRQMRYHNHGRRHSRLGYRSPMEYLASEGFVPKTLAEIGPKSGSVPGAHILPIIPLALRRCPSFLKLSWGSPLMVVHHRKFAQKENPVF